MPGVKGVSGNPNGRPKGAKNKTSLRMKELITKFAEDKLEDVIAAFDDLEPKDKVSSFTQLLRYVVPVAKEEDNEKIDAVSTLVKRLFERN